MTELGPCGHPGHPDWAHFCTQDGVPHPPSVFLRPQEDFPVRPEPASPETGKSPAWWMRWAIPLAALLTVSALLQAVAAVVRLVAP